MNDTGGSLTASSAWHDLKLVALSKHSVFSQDALWNINCFDQWGVEPGKALAQRIVPQLGGHSGTSART